MNAQKRKKLEDAGFRVGDAADFLNLRPHESELIDLRLKVSRLIRKLREQQDLTQKELAARIESSQSRVAKLENGDTDVSLDLIFSGFFALGGKLSDVIKFSRTRPARKTQR